jgi:hypothetical protein
MVMAAAVVGLVLSPGAGLANPWGDVDCDQFPEHAQCQTGVVAPGGPAWVVGPSGDVVCHDDSGEVVECYIEGQGWIGADGCRYFFNGSDGPPEGASGPGGWYVRQCSEVAGGGVVWLADSEAPGPGWLAQIAASRLTLPPPVLELSPPASAPQLVMLPTWLWVQPQWWQTTRSASASVPGITVVAVATPTEVEWVTGDGAGYDCGAGTPYTVADDPLQPSPDCGHTYTRTGVFTLVGTVSWQVAWSGGGASGTVGPLFSTTSQSIEVVESLSRNTGSL